LLTGERAFSDSQFIAVIPALVRLPWRQVKLEHAEHYLWITNRDEVLREMKSFLGT
jgi:hypothetical protein